MEPRFRSPYQVCWIGPHSYSSLQMVVLPLVWHLHPFLTVQPDGMGLHGSRGSDCASEAPAAMVIAVNTPRRTFFTMTPGQRWGRTPYVGNRKIWALSTTVNPAD